MKLPLADENDAPVPFMDLDAGDNHIVAITRKDKDNKSVLMSYGDMARTAGLYGDGTGLFENLDLQENQAVYTDKHRLEDLNRVGEGESIIQ